MVLENVSEGLLQKVRVSGLGEKFCPQTDSNKRESKLQRYEQSLSYSDDSLPNYNANQIIDNVWIGEGPITAEFEMAQGYDNIDRFFQEVIFNPRINFQMFLVLGPEFNGDSGVWSYYPYFIRNLQSGSYDMQVKYSDMNYQRMHTHSLIATHSGNPANIAAKALTVVHFREMSEVLTLDENDILALELLKIAKMTETQPLFIHCSAGLGRAGVIAYAIELYRRYEQLKTIDDAHQLTEELYTIWMKLNTIRPGTIQTEQQLINALHIADRMHQLQSEI